jgi:hypothetical protein
MKEESAVTPTLNLKRPSTHGTPFSTNLTIKEESILADKSRNLSSALDSSNFQTGNTMMTRSGPDIRPHKISKVQKMVLDSYFNSTNKSTRIGGSSQSKSEKFRRNNSSAFQSRN